MRPDLDFVVFLFLVNNKKDYVGQCWLHTMQYMKDTFLDLTATGLAQDERGLNKTEGICQGSSSQH
eukprot:1147865-Pelagomonas_calceolata.AAC.12